LASPRILYFDLENSPSLGWYYDRYREGNIVADEQDWFLLSFAWQWEDETKVHVRGLCDYPTYSKNKTDDSPLVKDLHSLLDECDIAVAHNLLKFDKRKANARFLGCGLSAPSPYKTIDTLKIARSQFMLTSNSLQSLGEFLGLGGKLPTTGWTTWRGAIDGDPKCWAALKKYNKRDVTLLRGVADKLRAWNPHPPDLRAYSGDKGACPSCGSTNVQQRGPAVSKTRRYQRMQCQSCAHWFQGDLIK
jgi:hypothetical protein